MVRYFKIIMAFLFFIILALIIAEIVILSDNQNESGKPLLFSVVGMFLAFAIILAIIVATVHYSIKRVLAKKAMKEKN